MFPKDTLKKILVDQNYLTDKDWEDVVSYTETHESSIMHYLIDRNLLTKDLYGQAIAEYFKVPYVDFDAHPVSKTTTERISKDIAEKYRVLFVAELDNEVLLATDNPEQKELKNILVGNFPNKEVIFGYALPAAVDDMLFLYRPSLQEQVQEILAIEPEDAPGVLETLFNDAIIRSVSDIHFEPQKKNVVVRFRIDGVLQEVLRCDHSLYEIIVNRIKVSANLRIDEHLTTQDGALHYENKDRMVDMRVSIVPVTEGEKIVIRLLGEYVSGLALSEIGMSENHEHLLRDIAQKPFGMILVVGPTGSGKTTTLYSLVKLLNRPGVNITTIEDPVEYKIPGVNQIQVNTETDLTFARGLRSIVRQDPDIILVGEIRDKETAEIAINAAMSGHLVLSTFHANDAATAIPRLLDMGVEPFLLASTLELVIAQRLVRTLREDARISSVYSPTLLKKQYPKISNFVDEKKDITLYHFSDEYTSENAFRGRTAVFEFLKIDSTIEDLVMRNPSAKDIETYAQSQGMMSMFEDGFEKIKLGFSTPEELLRIVDIQKKYEKKASKKTKKE